MPALPLQNPGVSAGHDFCFTQLFAAASAGERTLAATVSELRSKDRSRIARAAARFGERLDADLDRARKAGDQQNWAPEQYHHTHVRFMTGMEDWGRKYYRDTLEPRIRQVKGALRNL